MQLYRILLRRARAVIVLLAGCRPSNPPAIAPAAPAPATIDAMDVDGPVVADAVVGVTVLPDSPIHRHLAWLLDVIGKRAGHVELDELRQHFDEGALGAVGLKTMNEFLLRLGATGADARIDRFEVDDPTYVRADVATGERRWRLIMSLGENTGLIDYIRSAALVPSSP